MAGAAIAGDRGHPARLQHRLLSAAGRLFGLAPGRALEILFDHDPTFIEQASAGLWLDGEKVGDAPRRSREWLGRMLAAGRRLTARVEAIRPATEYDGPACLARVELTPAPAASPAVFLGEGRIHRHAGRVLSAGEVLRLAPGSPELERRAASPWAAPLGLETLAGEPAGRLFADQRGVAGRMAGSGLRVAVVVATTASTDEWARATIHLLD